MVNILVTNKEGYLSEVSIAALDENNLPIIGNLIVDTQEHYFYNLYRYKNQKNKYCLIQDEQLKAVSKKETVPHLKELVQLFVEQIQAANSIHLNYKRGTDLSIMEVIVLALKKGMAIKNIKSTVIFSEKDYQNIQNELIMYNGVMDDPIYNFVNNLIYGANTILAVEGKITPSPTGLFCYAGDVETGQFLNFKAGEECLAEMLDRGHVLRKPRK